MIPRVVFEKRIKPVVNADQADHIGDDGIDFGPYGKIGVEGIRMGAHMVYPKGTKISQYVFPYFGTLYLKDPVSENAIVSVMFDDLVIQVSHVRNYWPYDTGIFLLQQKRGHALNVICRAYDVIV
jgi:hypothetical protein